MNRFRLADLSYIAQQVQNSYFVQRMTKCPVKLQEAKRSMLEWEATLKQLQTKAREDLVKLHRGESVKEDFWS